MNKFFVCRDHITLWADAVRGRRGRTWNSNFSNNGLNFRYASNLFIWLSTFYQQLSKYSRPNWLRRKRVGNTLLYFKSGQNDRGLCFDCYIWCLLFTLFVYLMLDESLCSVSVYNCCGERLHLNFIDRETQRLPTNTELGIAWGQKSNEINSISVMTLVFATLTRQVAPSPTQVVRKNVLIGRIPTPGPVSHKKCRLSLA